MNMMLTGKFPNETLYDGPLSGIIKKCITLSPDGRYQSAVHLKVELQGYTDLLCEYYCEKENEYKSENNILSNALCWTVIYFFIGSFINNCIDKSWGIGFDYFSQIARQYLTADSYTLKEFILAITFAGWRKIIVMGFILMWTARSIKNENIFGVIFWIAFTIFDMQWQIGAFIDNQSLFATNSPIKWYDFANIIIHIGCIGLFIKILYNIRKINYYKNACEDIKNNTSSSLKYN